MALDIDRAAFFDAVRRQPFAGHLTADQVAGMEAILDACPADLGVEKPAYCLATTFHETARTMRPIEEFGRGKGKAYGRTGFWGRGYVQLTWEANYAKATARLRALGILNAGEDLVKTPALAMRPDVAAAILFYGMIEGGFTGKKLGDYFGPGRADAVGARRIINGTDCDKLIAGYHAQFRVALMASVRIREGVPPAISVTQPSKTLTGPPSPSKIVTPAAKPALTGGLVRSGAQATGGATRGLLNALFTGIHNALARKV
ncbi:hypothetical protein MKK70_21155 [Methylobacterium sp. E-041]|uniref:hypothetical protein n=1 Tax=Methylobacterium sp. E-041 TaxID=2836573 RepID=UPI001FB95151|nr:hypothetical protein [Methylobacterium sp. E-041]MCJ2107838.1 hypothetical protein [Methylobacterium sp. E-041]